MLQQPHDLETLERLISNLEPEERESLFASAPGLQDIVDQPWIPLPGPQSEAYHCEADELFYGGSAGGGKGLALDTELPTPSGFVRMGDVRVGDTLYDQDGDPCTVAAVSPVNHRPCFRVCFDDGTEIVADDVHRWLTLTDRERTQQLTLSDEWRASRREARPSRAVAESKKPWVSEAITVINREREYSYKLPPVPQVRDTAEIAETVTVGRGRTNHSIELARSIAGQTVTLPIEPYLLGLWLGDGFSRAGKIGMLESDWDQLLQFIPREVTARNDETTGPGKRPYHVISFKHLQRDLRREGLLRNKHIPTQYLRASVEQRRELLRGLADTDGHCDQRGRVEIGLSNRRLAEDLQELVCGLGIKAALSTKELSKKSSKWADSHRLSFHAPFDAFKLPRKLVRQKPPTRSTTQRRYIVGVDPVPSVPTRCIAVDSPSRTFLVGRNFVPTHNSDLVLGLALTKHKHSLILRRVNKEVRGLENRLQDILGTRDGYNSQTGEWKRPDGRVLQLGGCQREEDKLGYQGVPHDLKAFDEITSFTESQYRFIIGWNRSADQDQRVRVVATGNPPVTADGLWVINYWAPWLDPQHPNPAKPGELRWFTTIDGRDVEVDGPEPVWDGRRDVKPRSRTFIPATLEDNPFLAQTNYGAVLGAMPDELRRAMRDGDFSVGINDHEHQVIPTQWVREAQSRWTEDGGRGLMMTSVGVDPNGSGKDKPNGKDLTVIAPRYGTWYAPLIRRTAKELPEATDVAALILANARNGAGIVIDVGGGFGIAPATFLKENHVSVKKFDGTQPSTARALGFEFQFFNLRAEAWWRFREALDPSQDGGSIVALPPDPTVLADLCSPRYSIERGKIKLEKKADLKVRLGRSPDDGDAIVMAWSEGDKLALKKAHASNFSGGRPKVNAGYERMKRGRRS